MRKLRIDSGCTSGSRGMDENVSKSDLAELARMLREALELHVLYHAMRLKGAKPTQLNDIYKQAMILTREAWK